MTMDVATIKQAAAGRWPEILTTLGGIPAEVLDGQHHPCPKCGGTDRFRAFDDFQETGGVYCNQCDAENNGDGISTLQWVNGIDFKSAVKLVAGHLGIQNGNGHAPAMKPKGVKKNKLAESATKIKATNAELWETLLREYAKAKPPITPKGVRQCGGTVATWGQCRCIRLNGRAPIDTTEPTAVILVRIEGQPFPAIGRLAERKTHTIGGSVNSWLCSGNVEELQQATTIIDVEGVTDMLAVASNLPPGCVAVTSTAGAKARGKLPREWATGKRVIVAGDADEPGQDGRARSAAAYHNAGAKEILLAQLPYPIEKDHGRDIRDYLNEGHTIEDLPTEPVAAEQMEAWNAEKKSNKSSAGKNDEEDPGRIKTLADAICILDHFAQDAGGRLYYYKNGVYRPHGEKHVKAMVKTLLTAWGDTKAWSTRLASEVVEFIRTDAPELPDRPRTDMVNVENGMVRVEDGLLLRHDPKYLSAVQLPVRHNPAATCPSIEAFVRATFPPDADALAWEIPGVLMVPATWLQKAILLLGEGCNGKSVWLSLVVRFIGKHNVATMPLHKLEIDKFAVSRLVAKLANVCADLPSEHLAGTSVFKALTGGDSLTGEYKFRDSFDLEPYARLVFSANHPPRSSDSSAAFFRRWLVIPFDHTFAPDEQIPRDILDGRLQAPEELSGLLNKALDGLRRVQRQRRFSEPESTQAAWRDFHATTDPLAVWLDRYTIDDPDCIVTKQALRVAYNAAVERDGRPAMTAKAFGQAIYKLRPNIEEAQRTVGGKTQWCYLGIGLADNGHSRNSLDSRDSLLYSSRTREDKNGEHKGSSGVEGIESNPVNPVNPVDCPHTNVVETLTHDGYINRACRDCGTPLQCRKQEQPV